MRVKIKLETMKDAVDFSNITESLPGTIVIKDLQGLCVNAKSLLGVLHSLEFEEIWCESEKDIYNKIERFVVIE